MSATMKEIPAMEKKTVRLRLWRLMYDRGWTRVGMDDTIRSRVAHAIYEWRKWYAWGGPLMWLVGRYDAGSAGPPRGRDMWWIPTEYVEGIEASLVANFEQRHGCYVTHRYEDVRATSDIDWRIFDLQDDGNTVKIALYPNRPEHGGRLQPLPWAELSRRQMRLLLEWYLIDHKAKAQWFGIRRWLYYKALHASVADRIPFSCQATPGEGGYSHWTCQLRKRHRGDHRFRNYTWPEGGQARHQPATAR